MRTRDEGRGTKDEGRGKGKIFVISAPSGCGKTTLLKRLLKDKSLSLVHSISMTSRPHRADEKDGVDYHFVSEGLFRDKIKKKEFLEWEENFGNLYGTPRGFVESAFKENKNVLLSIDVKGAMNLRSAYPEETVLIFILPPSLEELKERLKIRKTDDAYVISERLRIAREEMAYKDKYDYSIINDNLNKAHGRLKRIILTETGA